jgi:hypothetical protein
MSVLKLFQDLSCIFFACLAILLLAAFAFFAMKTRWQLPNWKGQLFGCIRQVFFKGRENIQEFI